MNLNIRHLEYILEIYRCGSINKAAQKCYISQPQMSKIVKDVERELGYEIIQRDRSGLTFNRNGLYFIDSVEKILQEVQKIENIPKMVSDNSTMHVAGSPSGFIMQAFLESRKPTMGTPYRGGGDIFKECGLQEIIQQIVMRETPLGIMVMFAGVVSKYKSIVKSYNLSLDLLQKDIPVYLAMSEKHPLAAKKTVRIEDLEHYPFVLDSHVDYDDTVAGVLEMKDTNVLYVSNRASRYDALRSGYYICHASKLTMHEMGTEGICFREIEDMHDTLEVYSVKDAGRAYSVREREFLDFLCSKLQESCRA